LRMERPLYLKSRIVRSLTRPIPRPGTCVSSQSQYMDRFTALKPPTIIPCLQLRNEFLAIRSSQIHSNQDSPSRFVRRHMVHAGDIIVVGGNSCPIGQHTQEINFRSIVHVWSLSE